MKATVAVFALMLISASSYCQMNTYASARRSESPLSPVIVRDVQGVAYTVPKPPGLRMRNAGRTLTILGGAMLIGGIAVYGSADETYYTYNTGSNGTYEEGDPKAAVGVLMIVAGAGMTIPGVILWSKGGKKYKRYLEQQEDKTVSFDMGRNGLSLSYRF